MLRMGYSLHFVFRWRVFILFLVRDSFFFSVAVLLTLLLVHCAVVTGIIAQKAVVNASLKRD